MNRPANIRTIFKFFFLVCNCIAAAQENFSIHPGYGFKAGLQLAFGTHFQRAGICLNAYYTFDFVQINSEVRVYYSLRNLGPRMKHPELVLAQGVVFGYGKRTARPNPFLQTISNQTRYTNSVGYSYNAFFNKKMTSQQTGIVSLQFGRINFVAENDLLAKPALDRFRTGGFLLQYQMDSLWRFAVNSTMWTGRMGNKAGIIHPNFHYHCFMDTTGSVYGNYSNGLLSAQVQHLGPYLQTIQANVGIDAEQVRNAIQNEFIHDMSYIPKKYNHARNCHIPMIDREGAQYLYKEGQRIRKPKPYINLFANPNLFY